MVCTRCIKATRKPGNKKKRIFRLNYRCRIETGANHMSLIGQLAGGAGVVTTIAGQAQADQYIVLGDCDTANPLQGFSVEVDGNTYINIQTATLINAFMKWMMESISGTGVVGLMLKIATGFIRKNTTYRFVNSGVTTPNIFAFSDSVDGVPVEANTKTINANSFEEFDKFSALFLETPANIDSVDVFFSDGGRTKMTIAEIDAWFALNNQAEANGELGGVSVIDNTELMIKSVRINTNAVGACTVLKAKLPNAAFQVLKNS